MTSHEKGPRVHRPTPVAQAPRRPSEEPGLNDDKHGRRRSLDRMASPLSNETEVEESQEDNGMDIGAQAADRGRLDDARAQDRHRNAGQVEIERSPEFTKKAPARNLHTSCHGILLNMFNSSRAETHAHHRFSSMNTALARYASNISWG